MSGPLARPPQRIAVLRALYLGDLLVAVPALRALRAGFPDAEITLISLPWAAEIVRRFSHLLDRFVPLPGYPGLTEAEAHPAEVERFVAWQRAERYDLVVQMHGSGQTSNELAAALGGRITAGLYTGEPPPTLDLAALYPSTPPEILRCLRLAHLLECPERGTHLEFPLHPVDRSEAEALLGHGEDARPLVAIHAGAKRPAQRWPPRAFAAVADALAHEAGARIVLTGGPGEEGTALAVAGAMSAPAINLAGRTSLGALAAIIDRCDLFVSNDTGPAHLAVARNTPSVRIFGPADAGRWAPLDRERHRVVRRPVPCSPCPYWTCPIDHRCLDIAPDAVAHQALDLLHLGIAA